jgi:hypothetical protein
MKLLNIIMAIGITTTGSTALWAQLPSAVTASGLDNQVYIGYVYTKFDYEIVTQQGDKVVTTSGVSVQYNHRSRNHLILTGLMNYGSGSQVGQKLTTVAFGGGLVQPIGRLEPYAQVLSGVARLSSTDDLYLSSGTSTSFTYLLQAGVDLRVRGAWGIRPIYIEDQHLSFGPIGSNYRSIGGGVLYRFGSGNYARHKNGL